MITVVQYPSRCPQSGRLRSVPKTPIVSAAASLCFALAFGRTVDSNDDMSSPSSSWIPDFPKPSRYPIRRWSGLDRVVKLCIDDADVVVKDDDDCASTNNNILGVAIEATTSSSHGTLREHDFRSLIILAQPIAVCQPRTLRTRGFLKVYCR